MQKTKGFIKLDLTDLISVGGKSDCCFSQMCGMVDLYFRLPLVDNPLYKTRLTKTVKCEEGKSWRSTG